MRLLVMNAASDREKFVDSLKQPIERLLDAPLVHPDGPHSLGGSSTSMAQSQAPDGSFHLQLPSRKSHKAPQGILKLNTPPVDLHMQLSPVSPVTDATPRADAEVQANPNLKVRTPGRRLSFTADEEAKQDKPMQASSSVNVGREEKGLIHPQSIAESVTNITTEAEVADATKGGLKMDAAKEVKETAAKPDAS